MVHKKDIKWSYIVTVLQIQDQVQVGKAHAKVGDCWSGGGHLASFLITQLALGHLHSVSFWGNTTPPLSLGGKANSGALPLWPRGISASPSSSPCYHHPACGKGDTMEAAAFSWRFQAVFFSLPSRLGSTLRFFLINYLLLCLYFALFCCLKLKNPKPV